MTVDENKLAQAIEQKYDCTAAFVRVETVDARLHKRADWDGGVAVFSVDHPEADTCYAWSMPVDLSGLPWQTGDSTPEALFAVLKKPPVGGPADALQYVNDAFAESADHELSIVPVKGA